ncbi:MAG: tRNA (guanosine(37)-N1)-methyltransferase TrmD, partial [Bacteroidales bacterium]|nr:tRNA (guanosine(37)-N1)-methyltransferase TrmD [Bacteroidales bacterium]
PPVYTRPYDFEGHTVPDVLLSGNEKLIAEWKYQKALERTRERRPDLLEENE